jgi:hypothetical protein
MHGFGAAETGPQDQEIVYGIQKLIQGTGYHALADRFHHSAFRSHHGGMRPVPVNKKIRQFILLVCQDDHPGLEKGTDRLNVDPCTPVGPAKTPVHLVGQADKGIEKTDQKKFKKDPGGKVRFLHFRRGSAPALRPERPAFNVNGNRFLDKKRQKTNIIISTEPECPRDE